MSDKHNPQAEQCRNCQHERMCHEPRVTCGHILPLPCSRFVDQAEDHYTPPHIPPRNRYNNPQVGEVEQLDHLFMPMASDRGICSVCGCGESTKYGHHATPAPAGEQLALERLIADLEACNSGDEEGGHGNADRLLLEYINDPRVTEAYDAIDRWYA